MKNDETASLMFSEFGSNHIRAISQNLKIWRGRTEPEPNINITPGGIRAVRDRIWMGVIRSVKNIREGYDLGSSLFTQTGR